MNKKILIIGALLAGGVYYMTRKKPGSTTTTGAASGGSTVPGMATNPIVAPVSSISQGIVASTPTSTTYANNGTATTFSKGETVMLGSTPYKIISFNEEGKVFVENIATGKRHVVAYTSIKKA